MTTFYLDMDGVVADFDRAAEVLIGRPRNTTDGRWGPADWQRIRNDQHWFRNLPKMQGSDQLVDLARQFRDQHAWRLLFLTAIPRGNDFPWAFWDKIQWAQEHYPDIPVHFGPYSEDKQAHCQPGDLLVDDRRDNCQQWHDQGGTAVKVNDNSLDEALVKVRALLSTARSASG
jgi:hypothetical protein